MEHTSKINLEKIRRNLGIDASQVLLVGMHARRSDFKEWLKNTAKAGSVDHR